MYKRQRAEVAGADRTAVAAPSAASEAVRRSEGKDMKACFPERGTACPICYVVTSADEGWAPRGCKALNPLISNPQ